MAAPFPVLTGLLGEDAWLSEAISATTADPAALAVRFPQLPRRLSRTGLGGGRQQVGEGEVDLSGWRRCDAAAAVLLASVGAGDKLLEDLYAHGDLEERAMLLRSLAVLPVTPATANLLGEVQRTNMVLHVEAAVCDSDLLRRAAESGLPGTTRQETNNLLLKIAFLDLPLHRVFAGEDLANEDLSRMLQDLATEREAAGRAVWRDTDRMLCRAPVPGSIARILGGLEHGDDGRRRAATEALCHLQRTDLAVFAQERENREPRADIRALLEQLLASPTGPNRC